MGGAIKDATNQVLRTLNGLIENMFPESARDEDRTDAALFIPVIFTTAELWVAEGDLSEADLVSGELSEKWATVTQVPWLWYTCNQSPALRHHFQNKSTTKRETFDISQALHEEFSRTIAVVGADAIDQFLGHNLVTWSGH